MGRIGLPSHWVFWKAPTDAVISSSPLSSISSWMTEPSSLCCLHALVLVRISPVSPTHGSSRQHPPNSQDQAGSDAAAESFPTSSRRDCCPCPWPLHRKAGRTPQRALNTPKAAAEPPPSLPRTPRSLCGHQLSVPFPCQPVMTCSLFEHLRFPMVFLMLKGQMNSARPHARVAPTLHTREGEDAVGEAGVQSTLRCPWSPLRSPDPQQGPPTVAAAPMAPPWNSTWNSHGIAHVPPEQLTFPIPPPGRHLWSSSPQNTSGKQKPVAPLSASDAPGHAFPRII